MKNQIENLDKVHVEHHKVQIGQLYRTKWKKLIGMKPLEEKHISYYFVIDAYYRNLIQIVEYYELSRPQSIIQDNLHSFLKHVELA